MGNDGLDDSQPGIKTAGRNINNLRYADNNHSDGKPRGSWQAVVHGGSQKSQTLVSDQTTLTML